MMEVSVGLDVSAEAFFDALSEALIDDAARAMGGVRASIVPRRGLSYRKSLTSKVGTKSEVRVTVTAYDRPIAYAAEIASSAGTNRVSYRLTPGSSGVAVTYREDFFGNSSSHRANFKLMSIFFAPGAKRRMKRRLRAIEASIKAHAM